MAFVLKAGGYALPSPVSFSVDDELIWSSDTGRTLSGKMVGDVVAEKKKVSIEWQFLTEEQVKLIKSRVVSGFFTLEFRDAGEDFAIESYRGSMNKEVLGDIGDGEYWYRSVKVNLIQR